MRILRVAQTCYPEVTGGGAYHVHAMSRDQAATGHDVTVLTVRQDSGEPHVAERDGYTVVRYDPTADLLGNVLSIGLARYLRRVGGGGADGAGSAGTSGHSGGSARAGSTAASGGEFDVLHAHSHLYASTTLAALRRRLGGPPLAVTNHGLYSQTAPEHLFEGYLRTVGRWTFEQADLVFCYTDVDERRLRELGVTTDVAVVPNGVDTGRFRPDGPESELLDGAWQSAGPTVLFVGRLVDGKRPQDAIAAMGQVRETLPHATLAICGDGPLRAELERQATGDLADATRFLGHVEYDEMPAVYRGADLLVLPSRAEGMPRTVLEARATGLPVVTTDLEHVAAGTDPGVHTVPPGNVDAIAAAIGEGLAGAAASAGREPATGDDAAKLLPGAVVQGDGGRSVQSGPARSAGSGRSGGRSGDRSGGWSGDRSGDRSLARDAHDWDSTVRETTRALERLVATNDSRR